MGRDKPRRRSPIRHSVHTRDPRYNIPQYSRGQGERAAPRTEEDYLKEGYWKCVHCNRVNEPHRKRCRYCGREGNLPLQISNRSDRYYPMESPNRVLHRQLLALEPHMASRYSLRGISTSGVNTLILHMRGRGKQINTQITFNPVTDTYDIEAHRINMRDLSTKPVYKTDDIYVENLLDVLDIIKKQEAIPGYTFTPTPSYSPQYEDTGHPI